MVSKLHSQGGFSEAAGQHNADVTTMTLHETTQQLRGHHLSAAAGSADSSAFVTPAGKATRPQLCDLHDIAMVIMWNNTMDIFHQDNGHLSPRQWTSSTKLGCLIMVIR